MQKACVDEGNINSISQIGCWINRQAINVNTRDKNNNDLLFMKIEIMTDKVCFRYHNKRTDEKPISQTNGQAKVNMS